MNDDHALVKFALTADFVTSRLALTELEIAYGFAHGWIREADVVAIAEHQFTSGEMLSPLMEELAVLLHDEQHRVTDVIARCGSDTGDAWKVWLYLALAWLCEKRDHFEDPYMVVEMIYADFGYPDEISGLVRFLPQRSGDAVGLRVIDRRWRAYLEERGRYYEVRGSRRDKDHRSD